MDSTRLFYEKYSSAIAEVRKSAHGRAMTFTEKLLGAHLYDAADRGGFLQKRRGEDYCNFRPDRVAMQDATAQMALLQLFNSGKRQTAVPSTVHCDHLILASDGAEKDLAAAKEVNREVYDFLQAASSYFGIGFWKPGAGIIHQIVLENYAFPGGMMVGTDSHTPNAGGLGMLAIGVGGADAVDVMSGMEWELKKPKIIGVELTGRLSPWAAPKDVILKLAGLLTVKGGTNSVIEYFGPGAGTLSCTGKATICNMGAEVGATASVFPFDENMAEYLRATDRAEVAAAAEEFAADLRADAPVAQEPEEYYDRVIRINLSELRPYVNGPFTPDAASTVDTIAQSVEEKGFPDKVEAVLIGSCTNSSYADLSRAASVLKRGLEMGLKPKAEIYINPGSERIKATAARDGLLDIFEQAGATILTNACGPCIGQWRRKTDDPLRRNSIVTTFNRNFAKRADGNPNTFAFITSPETAVGYAFSGRLSEHPAQGGGEWKGFSPSGDELPQKGFAKHDKGYIAPSENAEAPQISPSSERLQKLKPFAPWDGRDFTDLDLLVKVKGKCTTDHISMAGPWLKYRGHLGNISNNLLLGATNAFGYETGKAKDAYTGEVKNISEVAKDYRTRGGSIIVSEDNYGEGSSREHAAMEPRYLGVKAIIAKSFARIHETNLKKQGVLALTFKNPADYDLIAEGDKLTVRCSSIAPGQDVEVEVKHKDGTTDTFLAAHTYNQQQIDWLRAGSALNYIAGH